jgi:hypothetical protein
MQLAASAYISVIEYDAITAGRMHPFTGSLPSPGTVRGDLSARRLCDDSQGSTGQPSRLTPKDWPKGWDARALLSRPFADPRSFLTR